MYVISCESTADLPFSYVNGRGIPVLFYSCVSGENIMEDNMGRNGNALPAFYEGLQRGNIPSTSQLNTAQYEEFFEPLLQNGDLLHIVFSSGLTKSYQNALVAAQNMRERFPDRKIAVVDSLCACCGYGMLVDYAADMRDAGATFDEVEAWLEDNRLKINHRFFSTDLRFYKKSGRVSGPAAAVATVLNLCPLMHLNAEGKIIAHGKVRGINGAVRETVNSMLTLAENGVDYSGKCFIVHSNCHESAEKLREAIAQAFPKLDKSIRILDIGMIIASHCGPGTVALFFLGAPRNE